jgi:single-stranded-DNA-specific exonuclease
MGARTWLVAPPDPAAWSLAAELQVHPLTAALLRRRGVTTVEQARRFLAPRLEDLADPWSLAGMDQAVQRVALAIGAGRRIAIHGDYDVDGISATAILLRGLRALDADPLWFLPHRIRDGYGLGLRAVEILAAQGAQLLITVDCGITAIEAVTHARALGLEVVILDHHPPLMERPAAVIVEPARDPGAPAPMCAAGLAFVFLLALRRHLGALPPVPAGLVSLAALGTVADVVPLRDDNRRLVAAGLAEMRAGPLRGIQALAEVAGIAGAIQAWHIGWQLGPRLNAPGRLGDPAPALQLLLSDDPAESRTLADALDAANRERQALLERTLGEAMLQVGQDLSAPAFVVAGEGWHPGVVGLVAGRLAEHYRRPVAAIGLAGETGRGSARSIEGFDLTEALRACGRHLLAFGGHALAAGFSIAREAVSEFRGSFQELASAGAGSREGILHLRVDAEVALAELTVPLVSELERLGPFGAGNPEPVLAVRGVRALNRKVVGAGQHLRMDVTDGATVMEAIGFAMAGPAELLTFTEAPVDLAITPERDRLNAERIRLRVQGLEVAGMDPEAVLADTGVLLDRLFHRAADYLGEPRYGGVEDAPALYTKVVGVTFDGRQAGIATLRPGDRLRLVREPANAHDPHAIQVRTQDGRMVGYLRAQLSARLSPSLDAGARYRATVTGITGGGDRTLGLNIFLERDEDGGLLSARPIGRAHPAGKALWEQLPSYLNGGRPWAPAHAQAFAAIAEGKPVALALSPGRGWATGLAVAAAMTSGDGGCALVVTSLRRQVLHRVDQLGSRLAPLGLRVLPVHGLQGLRERERVDAALRAGEVDVIVASAEVVRGGWADLYADRITAVLLDGPPEPTPLVLPGALAPRVCLATPGALEAALAHLGPGAIAVRGGQIRTGLRLVDRRGVIDRSAAVEEVLTRDEKTVVYVLEREECVQVAQRLREHGGDHVSRIGYLHGGLPARVRQIITQAFCEGRLGILVATPALDEEALPLDVRQMVIAALPPDRGRFVEQFGNAGFDQRPVTVTVLFGPDEVEARRRALDGRAPSRELLAAIYRALRRWRGDAPFLWPDDATWAELSGALPGLSRAAVDAALVIFEEADLAAREAMDARYEVQLLSASKRDLSASLRYREGQGERSAFEACAPWAVRATGIQLLQAAAGQDGGG